MNANPGPRSGRRHRVGVLGLGQLVSPTFTLLVLSRAAANFYHFRANIAQNFDRPRPSFYRPVPRFTDARQLSRRAASYAAHTPQIVQRHCLTRPATRPRHAAPRRAPRASSPPRTRPPRPRAAFTLSCAAISSRAFKVTREWPRKLSWHSTVEARYRSIVYAMKMGP